MSNDPKAAPQIPTPVTDAARVKRVDPEGDYCHAESMEYLELRLQEAERKLANEYICTCGLRVTPHRCNNSEGF